MKKTVFVLLVILALAFTLIYTKRSEQKRITHLLGSEKWDELTHISLELGAAMNLPDQAPLKPHETLAARAARVDFNYGNEALFLDTRRNPRALPYLGNVLSLDTMVPLENLARYQNLAMERVFEVGIDGVPGYVCVFFDGGLKKILSFSAEGRLLDEIDAEYRGISQYGRYLLMLSREEFQLYQWTGEGLHAIAAFETGALAAYLQSKAVKAMASDIFSCSDFQFEWQENRLTVWAFNVSTTAFLPGFLHLKFSYQTPRSSPKILDSFGVATKADRLPLDHRPYHGARIDQRFWVARSNDAQIDVFDDGGNLVKTIGLAPIDGQVATGGILSSAGTVKLAVENRDPQLFYGRYRRQNPIIAITPSGDFVLIARANFQNPQYQIIYTLLNRNGDILAEDLCANDLTLLGSGPSGCFSLTHFQAEAALQPRWLLASRAMLPLELKQHQGWWLLGFSVLKRAGFENPSSPSTIMARSRSSKDKGKEDDPQQNGEISAKLRANLLKAKQIRNIFRFQGFVRLAPPEQYALREISDAIYLKGSYFVTDRRGCQLHQFDREGNWLRAIGRCGQGPGEYQRPSLLARAFDDHFVMSDHGGIHLYREDGTWVKTFNTMSEWGISVGVLIWEKPERLYLSDPFPPLPDYKQYAMVELLPDGGHEVRGFGDRFHFWDRKFSPRFGDLSVGSFNKIGNRIWIGSPYNCAIEIFDLDGRRLKELKESYHPEGLTYEDFKEARGNITKKELFQGFLSKKILNRAIHPLGPLAVRTLFHPTIKYIYDVFDLEGGLLAKGLKSGASSIEILDTHGKNIVAKLTAFTYNDLNEEHLKNVLYQPEYEALFKAGFELGNEDDRFYLWLARLAD